ncbi:phosphoglycerate mutase [Delftia sp. PS-11]|uniref:phosphoglycerate mutase n=1 Tax=Delftia sp. PS-11 TaxID=2767222 RepID=UPI0024568622|nr:phosphoglycerate mutase [Delftia sp. PS-11]KAJ8746642.1 phosphoglycerate mutase [Delftia sp. PS-11]
MLSTAPLVSSAHAQLEETTQWIIPYAGGPSSDMDDAAARAAAWDGLPLPHLQALLALMEPSPALDGSEMDFSPPHERALARCLGLPDAPGLIPWAAWQAGEAADSGQACAYVTPCHWHIGADQVLQSDPSATPLDEAQSRQLLALLAPWFADDGIVLEYRQPQCWLARGALFDGLATASMDRAIGRDVRPWLPDARQARVLHRLQSEVQMLLYTHAFNDARAERGQQPINAFWVHGAGRLPAAATASGVQCVDDLRTAALQGRVADWRSAWQALDAGLIARLLERVRAGAELTLTLCGERNAVAWRRRAPRWHDRLAGLFGPRPLPDLGRML